jgi:hypothetical protein
MSGFRYAVMAGLLVIATSSPVFWTLAAAAHHLGWLSGEYFLPLETIVAEAPLHLQVSGTLQALLMILATALFLRRSRHFVTVFAITVLIHTVNWALTTLMINFNGSPGFILLGIEIFVLYLAVNDLIRRQSERT